MAEVDLTSVITHGTQGVDILEALSIRNHLRKDAHFG